MTEMNATLVMEQIPVIPSLIFPQVLCPTPLVLPNYKSQMEVVLIQMEVSDSTMCLEPFPRLDTSAW